jgi:hypothetical protein
VWEGKGAGELKGYVLTYERRPEKFGRIFAFLPLAGARSRRYCTFPGKKGILSRAALSARGTQHRISRFVTHRWGSFVNSRYDGSKSLVISSRANWGSGRSFPAADRSTHPCSTGTTAPMTAAATPCSLSRLTIASA